MMRLGRRSRRWLIIGGPILILLSAAASFALLHILNPVYLVESDIVWRSEGQMPMETNLSWPSYGQAAIATQSQGVVATNGNQLPHPTASTAKILTVMAVLERYPLELGEQGPVLVMTDADVASYNDYIARNGTNTPVHVGLQLTQYQAIQSIMLRSSNNMADTLAIWAFGSIEDYHIYANQMVERIGASQTVIAGDASGLSPQTTSTAEDMALLSLEALKNPVIAEIAAQTEATIPYAGIINNSNYLLSQPDVTGLKTGETVEAGGNFLLSTSHTDSNQTQQVVIAVYGAPLASIAIPDSYTLYQSAKPYITYRQVIAAGTVIAKYSLPNGETREAAAVESISDWTWAGGQGVVGVSMQPITQNTKDCTAVGALSYGLISVPIKLKGAGHNC